MKYQLVALLDEESRNKVEGIQRQVCKKYRVYKSNPSIYISLNTISNPDLEKLDKVITKVLSPYKKFKVNILNEVCIAQDAKQTGIAIDKKGYISRIARGLRDTMMLHEFILNCSNDNQDSIDLIISLANCNFNIKKAANHSPLLLNKSLPREESLNFAKIDRIELWKLNNNKKDSIVKVFNLKEY